MDPLICTMQRIERNQTTMHAGEKDCKGQGTATKAMRA